MEENKRLINAIYVYLESILKELETSKDVYLFPKPILYDL